MGLTTFLVLFVASAAIFAMSILVSNTFVGGIEFGQAHIGLGKAALLLLAVNVVTVFVPYGVWLTLPVWWAGMVFLFRTNFFAAWLPAGMSFVLYLIVYFVVLLALKGGPSLTTVQ